jgi:hypothetical protein
MADASRLTIAAIAVTERLDTTSRTTALLDDEAMREALNEWMERYIGKLFSVWSVR